MRFGSKEIYGRICSMVSDPNGAAQYEQLYDVVRSDTLMMLRRDTLTEEEREDIVQNVELAVFRGLVRFVDRFAEAGEEERNKYLCGIIYRKRADCLAGRYRDSVLVSYDGEEEPTLTTGQGVEETVLDSWQLREDLMNTIREVCALRTTPDKIIAFFLNKLTSVVDPSARNGSPAQVKRMLDSLTQREAADLAVGELETLMGCLIPRKVVAPLYEKLLEQTPEGVRGELPFKLSIRSITDSSSWISSKMRKQKENIIGGNGYDSASRV